jgi:hypothetical protein
MRKLIICTAVLMVVTGCGGEEAAGPSDESEEPAQTTAPDEDEGDEDGGKRCLDVSNALKRAIAEGLTVTGGGRLGNAAAVRSRDFEKVYYVSADILGSGIEEGDAVGTWATNSLRPGGGLIIAADSIAREFSEWGDAAEEGSPAAEVRGPGERRRAGVPGLSRRDAMRSCQPRSTTESARHAPCSRLWCGS